MSKIVVLTNSIKGLKNFRLELMEKMRNLGYEVSIYCPEKDGFEAFENFGCVVKSVNNLNRRGINPVQDIKLIKEYVAILKKEKPDVVLSYTVKPNIYGGIAAKWLKIPYIANITGLGTAVENKGPLQVMIMALYRYAFSKIQCIFAQNAAIKKFFEDNKLKADKVKLIPGSGVNLEKHTLKEYPPDDGKITFLFVGRLMKAKGIEELLYAAEKACNENENIAFWICGGYEDEKYPNMIEKLSEKYDIKYFGRVSDVDNYYEKADCIVLPSYHEGTSNVLLEAQANGRPVISTSVPGCIETFSVNVSGFACEAANAESLLEAIEKFTKLPYAQRTEMGLAGRKKVEQDYDRNIVTNAYIKEIKKILEE